MDLKKIIEEMPKDLTELEKARYIYIKLCEIISYNAQYFILEESEKQQLFNEEINFENWEKNTAICSSISKLYAQMLKKIGIQAIYYSQQTKYGLHAFNIITINGKNYYADLTRDTSNIQGHFKTQNFGKGSEKDRYIIHQEREEDLTYIISDIPFEEIKKIDNKLGYTFKGMYMDEVIERLRKETSQINFTRPVLQENETSTEYAIRVQKYEDKMKRLCEIFGASSIEDLKNNIIAYKVAFVKKAFPEFENLSVLEKSDCFEKILKAVIKKDDVLFYNYGVSKKCIDENNRLCTLTYFINKKTGKKLLYLISDDGGLTEVTEKDIQKFRPLSKNPSEISNFSIIAGIQPDDTEFDLFEK